MNQKQVIPRSKTKQLFKMSLLDEEADDYLKKNKELSLNKFNPEDDIIISVGDMRDLDEIYFNDSSFKPSLSDIEGDNREAFGPEYYERLNKNRFNSQRLRS